MSQVQEIYQGFKNLLFKDEEIEKLADARLNICFECPNRKEYTCGLCGCFLKAKVRSIQSTCPIDKW
jgi:radical SAM superfamily enzyme